MPPFRDGAAPPRWSATAVSGFVLSILGCVGVTAILGFILGIAGIVATRDGRRRGRGLAIAAIPISLVTGAASLAVAFGLSLAFSAGSAVRQLPTLLDGDSSTRSATVSALRTICSEDFNQQIDDDVLASWLGEVVGKHGKLVQIDRMTSSDYFGNRVAWNIPGRFVNGKANIKITFVLYAYELSVDDIDVAGLSPRRASTGGDTPQTGP